MRSYADSFNARDFDTLRNLLAEDVKLDLVNRLRLAGRKDVSVYFDRYSESVDWRFAPGLAEGRPALLVSDPAALRMRWITSCCWIGRTDESWHPRFPARQVRHGRARGYAALVRSRIGRTMYVGLVAFCCVQDALRTTSRNECLERVGFQR